MGVPEAERAWLRGAASRFLSMQYSAVEIQVLRSHSNTRDLRHSVEAVEDSYFQLGVSAFTVL